MAALDTAIGSAAAILTTASYIPQLRKSWQTGETGDLSATMLFTLASGLSLWLIYGLLRADLVIAGANGVSLAMLAAIIALKLRGREG